MEQHSVNIQRDLIIVLLFSIASFVLAVSLDGFENLVEWSHQHEEWEVDEIFTAVFISAFSWAIFSWRRWHELQQELIYRREIEDELKLAKESAEKAKVEAEVANKAKSTFLANMSHELRTPLNGVLGYTQILKRDKALSNKHLEAVSIIHRSGEYLLALINDILDLSKIEAGRVELYPTHFHLSDFLNDIVEMFKIRVKQKGIAFMYEKLSRLPQAIFADEKRLRQIIINLLSNAIKFTQEGSVGLKVEYQQDKMRFFVEDTGVGIAEDEIQYIFQPFRQVGDENIRSEGTGLGLSITQKLVEMMGGKLYVKSQLGKGSTFSMEIQVTAVENFKKSDDSQEQLIIGFEGESKKILVVDDEETHRTIFVDLLSPLGFEIIQARNGQECIDKTMRYKPALILMDVIMPVMDGFETTRRIRQLSEIKEIIIIMVSAGVFDEHKKQSVQVGCQDFLPKPIQHKDLFHVLKKYLNITWIYEKSESNQQDSESPPENQAVILPNAEQMAILLDLSMMGDLEGIVRKIQEFEKSNVKIAPFTREIQKLIDGCEADKVYDLIENYIK